MALRFTFIGNACGVFESDRAKRLLMDPWLVDGVFEGSWCHFPPLTTTFGDLQSVDAIYLSHIHPDHFDERFFDFPRSIPIFIYRQGLNFLEKRLKALGYLDVRSMEEGVPYQFEDLTLTSFGPFARHNFHEAVIGNVIDSALVVSDGSTTAFNANDNTPTPETCRALRERFGRFDLAMLNYNAAGPYPSCFNNLTIDEKRSEHRRILDRNMSYVAELLSILQPRACLPFAGAYVLGGRLAPLNDYLGTTTWDVCAEFLRSHDVPCEVITLRENDVLDLGSLEQTPQYRPVSIAEQAEYVGSHLNEIVYPYEMDPPPDNAKLVADLELACSLMHQRSSALGLSSTFSVSLSFGVGEIQVFPEFARDPVSATRSLSCSLDSRLLRRILSRKAQWNSAEIGCHISFVRTPNEYEPDLHTMMQFLHL